MTSSTELPGARNGDQGAETAEVLDDALRRVRAGELSETVLTEVPAEMKTSISSLLQVAQLVRETPDPVPDHDFKAKGLDALLKIKNAS